jgi:hypothetical protein
MKSLRHLMLLTLQRAGGVCAKGVNNGSTPSLVATLHFEIPWWRNSWEVAFIGSADFKVVVAMREKGCYHRLSKVDRDRMDTDRNLLTRCRCAH